MAVLVDTVRAALNTGTGTQDFTITGFGTPKAAMFIVTRATTTGSYAAGSMISVGLTDGTTQVVSVTHDVDAVGTTDGASMQDVTDEIAASSDGTTQTPDFLANWDSWITDGVRINITDAPPAAYLMTIVLFGGSDTSAHVERDYHHPISQDVERQQTGAGFEPDLIFNIQWGRQNSWRAGDFAFQFGYVVNIATPVARSLAMIVESGDTTTNPQGSLYDTYVSHQPSQYGGGALKALEFANFDASGFSSYERIADDYKPDLLYLALNFGGVAAVNAGTWTTPTSTGTDAITGLGFQPQFVGFLSSGAETINTGYNDDTIESVGIGGAGANGQFSNEAITEGAVGTSNTASLSIASAVHVSDGDQGTAHLVADLDSFDSDGFTMDVTTAPAAAKLIAWWAVEGADAGPTLQAVAGTLTTAGAIAKETDKAPAGTLTTAGAIATALTFARAVAGVLSSAGSLAKLTATTPAGVLSLAGDLVAVLSKMLAGVLSSAGSLAKLTAKAPAGVLSLAGGLAKLIAVAVAGVLSSAGSVARALLVALAGVLSSAGALSTVKSFTQALAGVLSSAGSLVRLTAKAPAGVLTTAGSLAKLIAVGLAGVLSSAGNLATLLVGIVEQAVAGVLSSAGSLSRQVSITPAGVLSLAGSLAKLIAVAVAGVLTTAGAAAKLIAVSVAGVLTSAGALASELTALILQAVAGVLSSAGSLAKLTAKAPAGALSLAGAAAKLIAKAPAGVLSLAGSLAKLIAVSVAGVLSSAGSLVRTLVGVILDMVLSDRATTPAALSDAEATPAALDDTETTTATISDNARG